MADSSKVVSSPSDPRSGQPGPDSSAHPAVAEERPVNTDRSEAGTGLTPDPVPAAEPTNLERAYELVLAQLRVGFGGNSEVARWIVADLHDAGLILDDETPDADELLRQAAAPLVPPDGAS